MAERGCPFGHRTQISVPTPVPDAPYPLGKVQEICLAELAGLGYNEGEAGEVLDVLLYAQLRGNTQGLIKVLGPRSPLTRMPGCGKPNVTRTGPSTAVVVGNQDLGILVMKRALDEAMALARDSGVGVVGTFDSSTTTGAIGYYCHAAASQGLVCIVMAQSPELVAPHGSYEPRFGTNPIAFGVPRGDGNPPLVFDMATSAVSLYGVKASARSGEPIGSDLAYDASGNPTTDANAALAGALRPFDRSYKGSHLALVIELLTGALMGGCMLDKWSGKNWANTIVVLDPARFHHEQQGLMTSFVGRVEDCLRATKAARPLPGHGPIRLPGESGDAATAGHRSRGTVPLSRDLASALGL